MREKEREKEERERFSRSKLDKSDLGRKQSGDEPIVFCEGPLRSWRAGDLGSQ